MTLILLPDCWQENLATVGTLGLVLRLKTDGLLQKEDSRLEPGAKRDSLVGHCCQMSVVKVVAGVAAVFVIAQRYL